MEPAEKKRKNENRHQKHRITELFMRIGPVRDYSIIKKIIEYYSDDRFDCNNSGSFGNTIETVFIPAITPGSCPPETYPT